MPTANLTLTGTRLSPVWTAVGALSVPTGLAKPGVAVPTGGLLSVLVPSSAPLDPLNNIGPNGTGWSMWITLKGITSTVGTIDATKLTVLVSDPGYTAGVPTGRLRTLTGVTFLRRQYPNAASRLISTDGVNVTMLVGLDDRIYAGSSIVSVFIASGFYPSCAPSNAGSISNQSTARYKKAGFTWVNPQFERSGSTFNVEAAIAHRDGQAGQMVDSVLFTVSDGTSTSSTLVTAPTLSSKITVGNPPEVWAAALSTSGLAQGARSTVNAKVYPWIGDANAVLDLAHDGEAWPTAVPQTLLNFFCDRTAGYGGAYAYVDGVGGGTPQVSTTAGTASANPYADIPSALSAIQTFNNANKGHNDLGGATVRLKDNGGSPRTHTVSGDGPYTNASTWCYIEKDPAAVGAVSVTWSTLCQMSNMLAWGGNGLVIAPTSGQYGMSGNLGANEFVLIHNCSIDTTGGTNRLALQDRRHLLNVTFTGSVQMDISSFNSTTAANIHALHGVSATAANCPTSAVAQSMLGCKLPNQIVGLPGGEGGSGMFCMNNKVYGFQLEGVGFTRNLSRGIFTIQNLIETDVTQGVGAMKLFADGDLTTFDNLVDMYNTAVGERSSRMYNDIPGSEILPNGLQKEGVSKYNIWDNYNCKTDTFNAGSGSVGNWAYSYSVGNVGNVSLFGDVGRGATAVPHNDATDPSYLGNAWLPSSEYNLFRTALGFTQAQIMAMFTNYTVQPQAVPALGGNYLPLSTATYLRNRVPAGKAALKYDLAGSARKNDGTGAAGCYEV